MGKALKKYWPTLLWRSGGLVMAVAAHSWAITVPPTEAPSAESASSFHTAPVAVSISFRREQSMHKAVEPIATTKHRQPPASEPVVTRTPEKKQPQKVTEPPLDPPAKTKPLREQTPAAKRPHATPEDNTEQLDDTASVVASQPESPKQQGIHTAPLVTEPLFARPPTPPNYPTVARKRGQQGTVWLDIMLDDEGEQRQLSISKSSGVAVLDEAALQAVANWEFMPYRINGKSAASRVRVPVQFALKKSTYH
ncbi:MAG: TonB family protein [Porticoccus sp.]|mgnify:FL=1|jgi:protein TonB|uniref:energy transducer TonB n=1 Tax=Porticoccus sp. TaxID=2024853 RepID=UPI003296EC6C